MQFTTGKAFNLGDELQTGILIAKSWEEISGRRFIVEKVPWTKITPEFQKLPPHHINANYRARSPRLNTC